MAAIKAYTLWFPQRLWPRINGLHLAAGGCGALTATLPVEFALGVTGLARGLHGAGGAERPGGGRDFLRACPSIRRPPAAERTGEALRGHRGRCSPARVFWRVTPLTVTSQMAFMSIHGPVVRAVAAGSGRDGPGRHRRGALLDGGGHDGRLRRRRVRHREARAEWASQPMTTGVWGMVLFMGVQALLIVGARCAGRPRCGCSSGSSGRPA